MVEKMAVQLDICATGHRPAGNKLNWRDARGHIVEGYDYRTLTRLVEVAKSELIAVNPRSVMTGAAQGWDTAVAIAAIQLQIPLTIVMPFSTMYVKWVQDRGYSAWLKTLAKADQLVVLHRGKPEGETPEEQKKCASLWLQERNEYMIDNSQKVLALFNGSRGGTRNAIDYAKKMNRTIRYAWPAWVKAISAIPSHPVR